MTAPPSDAGRLEPKYVEALEKLPRFKCGRLDLNTYLAEPVKVGRVESDVVRYIYFDDGAEVLVLGQRADEIAFAAAQYHELRASLTAARAELERVHAEHDDAHSYLSEVVNPTTGEDAAGPDLPLRLDEMAECAVKMLREARAAAREGGERG